MDAPIHFRLLTIPMSHYCEKVRWALEMLDYAYVELPHIQGFHYPWAWWHSRAAFVPILLTDAGNIPGSTEINQHLDLGHDRLYPPDLVDEVLDWERRLDPELGVPGRRWIYLQTLSEPATFLKYAGATAPTWERWLARPLFPLMRAFGATRLDLNEQAMAEGWELIEDVLADVEAHLEAGHTYLVGDAFTAADLSFASLMAPLILPRRYGIPLPTPDLLGPEAEAVIEGMRARPAGVFAHRLIEEHRPVPRWMEVG